MSVNERTNRVLDRAASGDADIREIEASIAATRADLDRNLSAIEQQLSPDALIHQAVTYLRSTPTEFFSNFGQAVKGNPLPTALLGVSLGWLMLSGWRRGNGNGVHRPYTGTEWDADVEVYEDRELYGRDASYDEGVTRDNDGPSTVHRVGEAMRSRASGVAGRASDVASGASDMGHRVSSKISEVGGKMSDANKHAQEVFQRARESVARARRTIAQQPKRVQAGAQEMAEQHPFVLGAIAFVAGAAIAASLKRTQFEDETIGEYRDQALSEAENRARSELERGVTSARSALEGSDSDASEGEEREASTYKRESARDTERDPSPSRDEPGSMQSQDRFH